MTLNMHAFRSRAGLLAAGALTWQIVAVMLLPAAVCCQAKTSVSGGASGEMANCPMNHMQHSTQDAACPMHPSEAMDHDCHCPTLSCAQTDQGFLALLGPIGILPQTVSTFSWHHVGDAVRDTAPSSASLAPAPVAPPPRA